MVGQGAGQVTGQPAGQVAAQPAGTVLAVLGVGIVAPAPPVVRAAAPGLLRGAGCLEGVRVRVAAPGRSRAVELDRHLARFARSARSLGIEFDADAWRDLIELACGAWPGSGEAGLRAVLTRGAPGVGPAGFVTISPAPPDYARQRAEGIAAITVARGYASDAFRSAPWLLGGVKALSYAVNMAAHREAASRHATEAIFVSADGFVLEAPTGSVVWATGDRLTTPPTGATGILAGTTQELLFERATAQGWSTSTQLVTGQALGDAEAIWILSSVRGPVEVVALDGRPRERRPELHAQVCRLTGF